MHNIINVAIFALVFTFAVPLAEQGDVQAQYILGYMYNEGLGVRQDYAEALRWYRMAAEQGHVKAQHNLGLMYKRGQGVAQDDTEAVNWFRMAAEQSDARAQNNLGRMYDEGRGVEQDYVQALMWFNLAASAYEASDEREMEVRDKNDRNRDLAASLMTSEQIAEAQKLAREWKPK